MARRPRPAPRLSCPYRRPETENGSKTVSSGDPDVQATNLSARETLWNDRPPSLHLSWIAGSVLAVPHAEQGGRSCWIVSRG
jgi:hypothetical protein